jgi:hypothetical protein
MEAASSSDTLVTTSLSHKVFTVFCLQFYVVHSTATISIDTPSCGLYLNYQLCYCTSVDMVATYMHQRRAVCSDLLFLG